jgi:hypothetical protein
MVWIQYMNVQCLCCCTVQADLLKFEAFIRKTFPFQLHLAGFVCIYVLLRCKGTMGEAVWASFTENTPVGLQKEMSSILADQ